jgi:hypothetical protein
MYSHGRVKNPNVLNRLLHEILGVAPNIKLTILFGKVNIYLLLAELHKKLLHRTLAGGGIHD